MKVSEVKKHNLTFPVIPEETENPEVQENTEDILHWVRARVYGECPHCHGTHSRQVVGWNKRQCETCGKTWTY